MERALVLILDAAGTTVECTRNDFLPDDPQPGTLFIKLASKDCQGKALEFLRQLCDTGVALGRELAICGGEILQFAGARIDTSHYMVMATSADDQSQALFEELIRIQYEQASRIRELTRDSVQGDLKSDRKLLVELSRVNNEYGTLQRELIQKNRELERLNEIKNRFVGMAAHDLRNPLGVIQGYCEFLMDNETYVTEPGRRFLTKIQKSAAFMLGMVADLLDVSHLESGKLELNLEMLEFRDLVEEVVDLHAALAKPKNISISCEFDEESRVYCDRNKMEQVLNNLTSNAVKYSPPGSHVKVKLEYDESLLRCSVQDEGPGVPQGERSKLFTPFGRTSVMTTGGESSTGLGLVIAKRVVEGHGGKIGLQDSGLPGSNFFFTIPVGEAAIRT